MTTTMEPDVRRVLTDLASQWRHQATLHGFPENGEAGFAARELMGAAETMLADPANDREVLAVVRRLAQPVADYEGRPDDSRDVAMLWLSVQNMATVLESILSGVGDPDGDPQSKQVSAVRGPLLTTTVSDD